MTLLRQPDSRSRRASREANRQLRELGVPGHGVITIDHGLLPTLIGFPGVLVAVVIGVTVFEVLLMT